MFFLHNLVCETRFEIYKIVEEDAECKVVRQPRCAPETPENEKQNCPTIPINVCPKREETSVKVGLRCSTILTKNK